MNPASTRAEAAALVACWRAHLQDTLELQAKDRIPPPLQKILIDGIEANSDDFLAQKEQFSELPGSILDQFGRKTDSKFRDPPSLDLLATPNTRRLSLNVHMNKKQDHWNKEPMDLTCDKILQHCKTSLKTLEIVPLYEEEGEDQPPGLSFSQLCSLLRELQGVTELHIRGGIHWRVTSRMVCTNIWRHPDLLICMLAINSPNIESLSLPELTVESMATISERWPKLKSLHAYDTNFDSSDLGKMKNLTHSDFQCKSTVLLPLSRAYDPSSPPYKQAGCFNCSDITLRNETNTPVSIEDMVSVCNAFPHVSSLTLRETDIPAVCAGLEGREVVHITELIVDGDTVNPRALEPLLALVGHQLRKLDADAASASDVTTSQDLGMIGHYCPNLEDLAITSGHITYGDEYEVTDTFFSHLKTLRIACGGEIHLPDSLLCHLLASPQLEDVYLDGLAISQEVFDFLMSGEGEERPLMSMKKFSVPYTLTSTSGFAGLLSRMPRLRKLTLLFFQAPHLVKQLRRMRRVLASFCSQSGLQASILID